MKTPMLLEVPKDSFTHKQRLNQIKSLCQIETHNCKIEDEPWIAVHMPQAIKLVGPYVPDGEPKDLFTLFFHGCRLMRDCEVMMTGNTEREAVRKLVGALGLPLTL